MSQQIKRWVSKNKRRYTDDGFDLDLTYICPNLLAMGFPADKVEGLYRNNIDDVVRFLESKHQDNYKVYNLCSERSYDPKKFHNRVASFPFDDHNPPKFELIKAFCDDVDRWLGQNSKNIAAIHCKAGKGRTGVMICCYLLHRGRFSNSSDVLNYYALARTNNCRGVTIPSQQRYVGYYSDLIRFRLQYKPSTLLLHSIRISNINNHSIYSSRLLPNSLDCLYLVISHIKVKLLASKFIQNQLHHQINPSQINFAEFHLPNPIPLCGDIKIEFFSKSSVRKKEKIFHFCFNTFFLQFQNRNFEGPRRTKSVTSFDDQHPDIGPDMIIASFQRSELDNQNKDQFLRLFPNFNFEVQLLTSSISNNQNHYDDVSSGSSVDDVMQENHGEAISSDLEEDEQDWIGSSSS